MASLAAHRLGVLARPNSITRCGLLERDAHATPITGQENHMAPLEYLIGTYNPIDRPYIFGDPTKWTPLQVDIVMAVATAKYNEFVCATEYVARLVRSRLITKQDGVDTLHEAAVYNGLYADYGRDEIQSVIAAAFESEAA